MAEMRLCVTKERRYVPHDLIICKRSRHCLDNTFFVHGILAPSASHPFAIVGVSHVDCHAGEGEQQKGVWYLTKS